MNCLTAGESYTARLAIEAGEPVSLSTMWLGTELHDELTYEEELRLLFDRYTDSMQTLARRKGLYPPTRHFWQLPWELRLIHMEQECLNDIHSAVEDLDYDMVSDELESEGFVRIIMAATLYTLAEDLTKFMPWYKRWFITRRHLAQEIEKRVTFLA